MPNVNENVSDFLSQVNLKPTEVAGYELEEYDTIIFDADDTIWEIMDSEGEGIYASLTTAPYRVVNHELIEDSKGSQVRLQKGFKEKLYRLRSLGKNIYVVSSGEKQGVSDDDQPVVQLLKTFNIYQIFDDVIIDGVTKKSKYVAEFQEGDTAFLDDQDNNLVDVSLNTNAEPIDVKQDHNLFGSWYGRVILGTTDYTESKESIEEDAGLASNDIYTQRSEKGEIEYRVDLKSGLVKEVGLNYRKLNPNLHPNQSLAPEVIQQMREQNKVNMEHFKVRLDLLAQNTNADVVMDDVSGRMGIDDFVNNDNILVSYIKQNLLNGKEFKTDRLEHLINHLSVNSKFVAGVVNCIEFIKNESLIGKIEAHSLANQIANYEVYGAFDGLDNYRFENNMDLIPTFERNHAVDETSYIMRHILNNDEDMEDPETKTRIQKLKEQLQIVNDFIKQGIYMYEDQDMDIYSDAFQEKFPSYVENSEKIAELTQELFQKMQNCADKIMDQLN